MPETYLKDFLGEIAPRVRPVFVGTERGMESRLVPEFGFDLELVQ